MLGRGSAVVMLRIGGTSLSIEKILLELHKSSMQMN
jgi:hypothetical protein